MTSPLYRTAVPNRNENTMSTKVIYQDVRKVYVETDDAGLVRVVIEQKHGIEEINAREDTLTFTADLTIRDMLSDEISTSAAPLAPEGG